MAQQHVRRVSIISQLYTIQLRYTDSVFVYAPPSALRDLIDVLRAVSDAENGESKKKPVAS